LPGLAQPDKQHLEASVLDQEKVLWIRRWSDTGEAIVVANFSQEEKSVLLAVPAGHWHKVLDSGDERWRGPRSSVPPRFKSSGKIQMSLSPDSVCVFERQVLSRNGAI
jgi:hypothetical protein